MKTIEKIDNNRLEEILEKMDNINVGILGDICLDVYWHADMRKSELSLETPHFPLPIVDERTSPGGGANVAANMAALKPNQVSVFGAVGNDWRGRELISLLSNLGMNISGIAEGLHFSNAYIKPLRKGISDVVYEDPRLDFVSHEPISSKLEDSLIAALDGHAGILDVLCISDQLKFGVVSKRVREHVCALAKQGLRVIADSRYNIGFFTNTILKPNEFECAAAVGVDCTTFKGIKDYGQTAQRLAKKTNCDVFMTIGKMGSIYTSKDESVHILANEIEGPIDIVGAGDSSLSGFALALATGAQPWEAACVAGLCSAIAVQQIGITGTATREQILDLISRKS